jgi:hypothetical protein
MTTATYSVVRPQGYATRPSLTDIRQMREVENAPTGWRGGTGRLELIFRDAHGTLLLARLLN